MFKKLINLFNKSDSQPKTNPEPEKVNIGRCVLRVTFDDGRYIEREFTGKYSASFNRAWPAKEYATDYINGEWPTQVTDDGVLTRIPRHRVKDYKFVVDEEYWVNKHED